MQTQTTFQTHGTTVTNAALWFVVVNPVLWFLIYLLAAWLMD
jgi:hypothetical protein